MTESSATASDVLRAFHADPRLGPEFKLARIALEGDGALVLEGEVADLAKKKLALRCAASAAPDVRGIIDRIRVLPGVAAGDREIRAHLRELFASTRDFADLDVREDVAAGPATVFVSASGAGGEARGRIDIEVENGAVTLNGYVPTLVRKRLAGALCWRIASIRDVINALIVRPDEEDGPDQIEEAVRVVLDRNSSLDAAQIKAGVRLTVVRLTGLVHTQEQRRAAEADAWSVFGVDDVINEIEVRA